MDITKYTNTLLEDMQEGDVFTVMPRVNLDEKNVGTMYALYYKVVRKGRYLRMGYDGESGAVSRGFTRTDYLVKLPSNLTPQQLVAWMKLEGWNLPRKEDLALKE